MTVESEAGDQLLIPVPHVQHKLGGLGLTKTYELFNKKELELVHIGRRSFVTAESLKSYVERLRSANQPADEKATAAEKQANVESLRSAAAVKRAND